jgi:hypothetical protein
MRQISSSSKTIKLFPEGLHELHNDYESEELTTVVSEWLIQTKNKSSTKWKQIKRLNLDHVLKRHFFGKILLAIIGILLSILVLFKKGKPCLLIKN